MQPERSRSVPTLSNDQIVHFSGEYTEIHLEQDLQPQRHHGESVFRLRGLMEQNVETAVEGLLYHLRRLAPAAIPRHTRRKHGQWSGTDLYSAQGVSPSEGS